MSETSFSTQPSFAPNSTNRAYADVQSAASATGAAGSPAPAAQSSLSPPQQQWNSSNPAISSNAALRKTARYSQRSLAEREIQNRVANTFHSRLCEDHLAVYQPDVDTPFVDATDVVKRLLPYHIYQHSWEDVEALTNHNIGKGKGKATEDDLIRAEIAETKFALQCFKQKRKLQNRFTEILRRSSQRRPVPDPQGYVMAQAILDSDREENSLIASELRSLRSQLDEIERAKRQANRAAQSNQQVSAAAAQAYQAMPQYRAYAYPYAQAYGIPAGSSSTFPLLQQQLQLAPLPMQGSYDIQLPVSSLPSLHSIGIIPVPASGVSTGSHNLAVIKGNNSSTTITLEINGALLQPFQASALSVLVHSGAAISVPNGNRASGS